MVEPFPLPEDEQARLQAMWRYSCHDRGPTPELDAITRLAADYFDMPLVLINLVDEGCLWSKSRVGLEARQAPRETSFCAYTVLGKELFEVLDATQDPRFQAIPVVTGPPYIRFYLGMPLVTPEGFSIGTLCLMDSRLRSLSEAQKVHLKVLGDQVMRHFEWRRVQRVEEAVAQTGLGTWELDVASGVVWGNAEFQRLHGAGHLLSGNHQELAGDFLAEDRERLLKGLEAIIQDGTPFEASLRLQPPGEPSLTWVRLTGVQADTASPARHLAGTLQDITPLKNKEGELEWRHRIDQLVTQLQSGLIAGEGISSTFTATLETLLAFSESEYGVIGEVLYTDDDQPYLQPYAITNTRWDETTHDAYRQAGAEALRFSRLDTLLGRALQSAQPVISNMPNSDSRGAGGLPGTPPLQSLLCVPVLLEGKMVAMLGLANRPSGFSERSLALLDPLLQPLAQLVHSLRLQRQKDAALERLELSAKVFSSSREAIMITDAKNRIMEVNEAFERITGYSRDEVLGKNPRLLSSGRQNQAFYQTLWRSLKEDGYWQGEMLNRRKSGELLPEMLSISVVRNDAGEVTHHVGVFSDLTRFKQHADELFRAGRFDPLTGMPNRYHMVEQMRVALRRRRPEESLAVAVLDLDHFQAINARLGHEEGDRVLVALAERLAGAATPGDLVARLGGDEFAFLLHHVRNAGVELERIIEQLAEPLWVEGEELRVTGSLGVTLYPADGADPETLLRHADQAMYRAKVMGGNGYIMFDPGLEQEIKALQVRRKAISQALLNDEFVLYYQPQIDPHTQNVMGVEALIRWQHPTQGLLAPGAFLPAIADSELELAFDAWVLDKALGQLQAWLAEGLTLAVCINLTPQSLTQESFVDTLSGALAAYPRVPPALLCLEVLESTALNDIQAATRAMRDCRALGVKVALDDFGTGYSSLAYLRNLPVDTIKVDRSFVMGMLEREADFAIVESVIYLAKRFDKQVVAEGVESAVHIERLREMGCDLLQGFGIARPMPVEAIPGWCGAFAAGGEDAR